MPLDVSGVAQDESGGAARKVWRSGKDSPVASLSRLRPRAAV
jgi:hypothetical protein